MSTTQQPPVAYSSTAVYTAGMTVIENGVTYQANWWVQGTDPGQNSGVADSGEPWTIIAGGSTDPKAWSAASVYTVGMKAIEDGVIYQANWWTQGNDPEKNSMGAGQPWTVIGAVDPAHAVPTVPTGLAAIATSSSAAILSWNASIVPGNAPVTGYAIFENGQQVGTASGTSYTATNLTANTSYQFSVAALDAVGSSAEATPINVHTAAGTGGSGGSATRVFSPYIDMAMSQDADLAAISHASGIKNFTLAFMLSTGGNGIGWQGAGTIAQDTLYDGTTILSHVQAIQAAGGNVTISFGGAAGQEAALTATSAAALQAEYQSVIDRYHVTSIDFDIEGAAELDQHSITLRDQALVGLEAANPNVKVSFTLPVLPTGLDASGLGVLQSAKHDGVRIDTVNIMTMDYGASVDNNGQMGLDAIDAIIATESQIGALGMFAKIGVTPLIGVNDIASEVFTLADAQQLVTYAESDPNVVSIGMWSVARDNGNSAGAHFSSPDSSGIAQSPYAFSAIFDQFDGGAGGGTTGTAVSLTVAQFLKLGAALPAADTVTLADTSAHLSALTAAQIATLAGKGVDIFDATNDVLSLTVAQYQALGTVALAGADKVTLRDTGAHLAILSAGAIAALAGSGIDSIDATDNVLSLTVAQYQALGTVALTGNDVVTLADTGAHLGALSAADIGVLHARGIDRIDATDNALSLGVDQFNALGATVLATNDAVTLTGTAGNDSFSFIWQTFTANDHVNGGAGTDTLGLRGDYSGGVTFNANTMVNVERLGFAAGYNYDVTLADGNVGAGQSLSVIASSLGASDSLIFDGSAETNGTFKFTGGAGTETFTGGAGADAITAGSGHDTFRYTAAAQSTGTSYDTITGFDVASDRLSVWTGVTGVGQAVTSSGLSTGSFNNDLAAAMSGLGAHQAVLFTPNAGNLAGDHFLVVDANGVAGYQAGSDLVVRLDNPANLAAFGTHNFA